METTFFKNLTLKFEHFVCEYQFHKRLFPIFETFFFSPCRVIRAPVSGNINDNVSPSLPVVCVHLKYLHSGKTLKYFPCGSKVHSLFFLLSLFQQFPFTDSSRIPLQEGEARKLWVGGFVAHKTRREHNRPFLEVCCGGNMRGGWILHDRFFQVLCNK